MPSISYQLYSSRNWDDDETFAMLSELGIREVEGFGRHLDDPAKTRALLDRYGMTMPTAHFALAMVENAPERTIEIARALGIEVVIVPYLQPAERPATLAAWQDFVTRLAGTAERIVAAGLDFAWHNHEFELLPVEGVMPLDLIAGASEDIKLELDLAWVKVAGQSPEAWLGKHAGRIVATHVKDLAPEGENADEGGWADVGHGILDWKSIKPAMDAAEVRRYVIEHDDPRDHVRTATRSLAAIQAF